MIEVPKLKLRLPGRRLAGAEEVVDGLEARLGELLGDRWRPRQGEPGGALVRLFGRLAELVLNRLHGVRDKNLLNNHFLAFLRAAGVDLLPPRGASAEVTFALPEDGPALVRVPAGTQVATAQTETRPEVVFETANRLVATPNELVKCVAFDPLRASDRTAIAGGETAGSFPVFRGQVERRRVLYLGDDQLFAFDDDASRRAATITLRFEFVRPADPAADWKIEWLYGDGQGWKKLEQAAGDGTRELRRNGALALSDLPPLAATTAGDESGLWIAGRLTGGTHRGRLPVLKSVTGERAIHIGTAGDWANAAVATADAAWSAILAGTAFLPLDPAGEFYPLGQGPGRLDTFYLRADEAFAKAGATVRLRFDLEGVPAGVTDTSELGQLTIAWEYHGTKGWTALGESTRSGATGITDTSKAFTAGGAGRYVGFKVSPDFTATEVEGDRGLWVRARVKAGGYSVPAGMKDHRWIPPVVYPPLVSKLEVAYTGYVERVGEKVLDRWCSEVDGTLRSPSAGSFRPFDAADEGPALYLGLRAAFPAGEWIQLLLDVDERGAAAAGPAIAWEYWNGSRWRLLRASDGSEGLRRRGYLGFFAPGDHAASTAFDQSAYWIQASPARPPAAEAVAQRTATADGGTAAVTLDASRSAAFGHRSLASYAWRLAASRPIADAGDRSTTVPAAEATVGLDASRSLGVAGRPIARYAWRLASSRALAADAGADRTVRTAGDEATLRLDASGSRAATAPPIAAYRWRRLAAEAAAAETVAAPAALLLRTVRLNTVTADNATTVAGEVLGASDGRSSQEFRLLHPPVLPGAELAVREPDRPPDEELLELEKELQTIDPAARSLVSGSEEQSRDVWVRWHQVSDFHRSTPASRHYVLDPIAGSVRFGDGERGMIPPAGQNSVKMVRYRTHDGARGNVAAGEIAVLRNPVGDLADVKAVSHPEAAAGGSDAETVAEVEVRGPRALKHRGRAVTVEDFAALAREASGEVAQARCLPGRNARGLSAAGWVTVVVLPAGQAARPTPRASLVRRVREHLEANALANLAQGSQLHVQGPDYVAATVKAKVAAVDPRRADEVELAVIERLELFLHPLGGGADRRGWDLGRDVYLSEVYAEIESVAGVDHVEGVALAASLQQLRLTVESDGSGKRYRRVPYRVSEGSRVGTFDQRSVLRLARPLLPGAEIRELVVYGFRIDDQVELVRAGDTVVEGRLVIASLAGERVGFSRSFVDPGGDGWALRSADGLLRLPVAAVARAGGKVSGVELRPFAAGDELSVVAGRQRHPALEWLPVARVEAVADRVFIPAGHLPCSGDHDVEMVTGEE